MTQKQSGFQSAYLAKFSGNARFLLRGFLQRYAEPLQKDLCGLYQRYLQLLTVWRGRRRSFWQGESDPYHPESMGKPSLVFPMMYEVNAYEEAKCYKVVKLCAGI